MRKGTHYLREYAMMFIKHNTLTCGTIHTERNSFLYFSAYYVL